MFKLKSFVSLVLILALAFCATPVFAQARYGVQSSGAIESHSNLELPAGTWVYGIKLYADASSSWMAVYNSATTEGQEAYIIDEIGEATQYDSQVVWYPKPIYCANGVSVRILIGTGYVYYGPAPTN